ncbi:MAG TPA: hypothetical protein DHV70_06380 [Firmicutes bacterium]|nr:hypothetical protein [Bacillota bacterium]
MKVITICGSLKFQNEMMSVSEKLSLEGNCVFMPVYPVIKRKRNKEELDNLKKIHFKKVELSDAIFVINKDKYTGEGTNLEIEYVKKSSKEILYLE